MDLAINSLIGNKHLRLKPFLKWPGGKSSELSTIESDFPKSFSSYYEPFVGGGAVYWHILAQKYYINDKSHNLINLYEQSTELNESFTSLLKDFDKVWVYIDQYCKKHAFDILNAYHSNHALDVKDVFSLITKTFRWDPDWFIKSSEKSINTKILRMKKLEEKKGLLSKEDVLLNIEGSLKAALYFYLRYVLNSQDIHKDSSESAFLFFAMREYSYASMFRYNAKGEFNVPYGGVSYNKKLFKPKLDQISNKFTQVKLAETNVDCMDFEEFLNKHNPTENDFIFLDPPYDTEFSTYDQNIFDFKEQERLANYTKDTCKARFMLVIKNTDFIYNLYKDFNVKCFDKKYTWNIKDRNNRGAEHLVIMNY